MRQRPLRIKIKTERTGDFVIVGFTEGKGSRAHFGALQLADMVGGTLCYAGRAGTGFDDKLLGEIKALLDPIVRADAPSIARIQQVFRRAVF